MKVRYKGQAFDVEVEGKDSKDAFVQLASAVEVFGNTTCGACGAPGAVPVVRENGGNQFHEMRCRQCGACLALGTKREGGQLFPKKKDKDGNWLDNNGWVKFKRTDAAFE
jgi:hypothetical protein